MPNVVTLIIVLIFNFVLLNIMSHFIDESGKALNIGAIGMVGLVGVIAHTLYLNSFASELAMWARVLMVIIAIVWMFTFFVSFAKTGMLGSWLSSKKPNSTE